MLKEHGVGFVAVVGEVCWVERWSVVCRVAELRHGACLCVRMRQTVPHSKHPCNSISGYVSLALDSNSHKNKESNGADNTHCQGKSRDVRLGDASRRQTQTYCHGDGAAVGARIC